MKNIFSFCSRYFFTLTILILLFLAILSSYFRFVVQNDYVISFEGWCDPERESCFVNSYEDEECTDPDPKNCLVEYTYKIVEKPVKDYRDQISECDSENPYLDPMECEFAENCSDDEEECSIKYCDPDIDSNCFILDSNLEIK